MSSVLAAACRTAIDLVLPRCCPGCDAPVPWCDHCAATIAGRPRAVQVPEAMLDRLRAERLPVPSVHALARYTGPVRAAIIAGKERGRRDMPPLLGDALGRGLLALRRTAALAPDPWLVPAPTRAAAARARGGDPVTAMARRAAQSLASHGEAAGVAPCLGLRRGARDSVGMDADGRAANLRGNVVYRRRAQPPSGVPVVLLDDVLTTGATVISAMLALRDQGIAIGAVLVLAAVPPLRPTRVIPRTG